MSPKRTALGLLGLLSLSTLGAAEPMDKYGPQLQLHHVENSHPAGAMVSTGDYLYTANSGRLHIYSLKNPLQPQLIKEVKGFKGGRQMTLDGNHLYITSRSYGLWIFDISDRENPRLVRRYDTTELATGIYASQGICYVAHRVFGTQLLDVRNPQQPQHLSTIRTHEAQTVLASGKLVFLGDWGSGEVTIASIENPRQPQILTKVKLDGFGDGLDINGNLCLASTGHHSFSIKDKQEARGRGHGLEIIDITNPQQPVKRSIFKFPRFYHLGNDFWTVRSCGTYAFAIDTHNGFFMLDIANPDQPRGIGYAILPNTKFRDPADSKIKPIPDCATSIALGDGCVYITGMKTGLYVIHAPGKAKFTPPPQTTISIPPATAIPDIPGLRRTDITEHGTQVRRGCLYADNLAFFACSHEGIKTCRLHEDGSVTVLHTQPVKDAAYDLKVHGQKLFAAEGADGIAVYDIQQDGSLKLLTRYHQRGIYEYAQVLHLYCQGTKIAWHGRNGRLMLLDYQNGVFTSLGYTSRIGILYNDNLTDADIDGVIACNFGHGHRFIDLGKAIPKQPLPLLEGPLANIRSDHNCNTFAVYRDKFILPAYTRFQLYDPKKIASEDAPETVIAEGQGATIRGMVSVSGDIVAVVTRSTGNIQTFDLSQPGKAVALPQRSWTDVHGIPDRAFFWQGRLVIPAGHDGVYVETAK